MASRSEDLSTVGDETRNDFVKSKLPTLEEIRRAVPAHCFERSILKSMSYLVLDIVIIAFLYYGVPYAEQYLGLFGLLVWYPITGVFMASLFCVGHDCGHGSFSDYETLNDIVGHLVHAPLFVPYWPWQKSHRHHHQYTAHLEKDKGHPWVTEEKYAEFDFISKHFPKFPLFGLIRPLFTTTADRIKCVASTSLCFLSAFVIFVFCHYNLFTFLKYYCIPLLFMGFWIILATYLQHHEEDVEVYENDEWSFVRGQLQTIDRTYGFFLDTLLHNLTDAHHLFFTRIPHYHLKEATKAIRKVGCVFKSQKSQVLEPYGVYKHRSSTDFIWKFFVLNAKLEYLVGKGTGLLRYPVASHFSAKDMKDN